MMQAESLENKIPFTIKRWLLLGGTSIILCLSFLLTIFTPYPIALSGVFFGKGRAYLLMLISLVAMALLSYFLDGSMSLLYFFGLAMIFASFTMETVLRNISPIKGIVISGTGFILVVSALLSFSYLTGKFHPKEYIISQIKTQTEGNEALKKELLNSSKEGSIDMAELINQPELLADQVLRPFPSYFIVIVYLTLWTNVYLVLRSRRLLSHGLGVKPETSEKSLLRFSMPFVFIWAVIVGLILVVFGNDYFGSENYEIVGMSLLSGLGVFYFFQGFSIFLDFLTAWKIFGFFRFIIVMLSVVMASWAFALIGLFDGFFDFRKFLKKDNQD